MKSCEEEYVRLRVSNEKRTQKVNSDLIYPHLLTFFYVFE